MKRGVVFSRGLPCAVLVFNFSLSFASHYSLPRSLFTSARSMVQEYKKREPKLSFLAQHQKIIESACDRFEHIPGFDGVIQSLCTHAHEPSGAKGYLYELEAALYLAQVQQDLLEQRLGQADIERIISFGSLKQDPAGSVTRSFDIETTLRWIECKNISWGSQKNKKMKSQFSEQQYIVKCHNRRVCDILADNNSCNTSNTHAQKSRTREPKSELLSQAQAPQTRRPIVYTVFSKTALSGYWRRWFDERGINYVEKVALD